MRITTRIRILALGLVAVTALIIGTVVFWGYARLVQEQRYGALDRYAESRAILLERAFEEVTHDVRLLASLPAVRSMRGADLSPEGRGSAARRELTAVAMSMLRAKPYYSQVRVLDGTSVGREYMRVRREGASVQRVPEAQLQTKGHRGYYQAALEAGGGRVTYSEVSLNQEFGQLEVPHVAVLRAMLLVESPEGGYDGMVVINVDFRALMDELLPQGNDGFTYYLANEEGDYLRHPDSSQEFAFDLGTRRRVQERWPQCAPVFETGGSPGRQVSRVVEGEGELVLFRRVAAFPEQSRRFLVLGVASPGGDVAASAATIRARGFQSTLVILLFGAVVAGFFAAALITRPLRAITSAADRVASGEDAPLPVERPDEIGVLARALDRMLGALRREERRLAEVNARLRAANEDLEHFAHITSHDLREPVSRVASLADLALHIEGERLTGEGREVLERLRESATQMVGLIRDFRSLTQIDRDDLLRVSVDLRAVAERVVSEQAEVLASRAIRVEIEALPRVEAYEHLTRALYRNLFQNALDHGAGRGMTVRFTAERAPGRHGGWVLGVWNTGSTIPEGEAERVFAPFRRIRGASECGGDENSGLGLSICRRIVERHAGRIWAESGPDHVHMKFILGGRSDDVECSG